MTQTSTRPIRLVLFGIMAWLFFVPVQAVELEHIDGYRQDMAKLIGQGRWVVMNVWSPSCSFCVEELPHIWEFHRRHGDTIDVIG
ncbi:MAG: hypothetical protein R3318_01185, partial [Gammaproteobacteria bacterium]|nr:hypothetical protein [Gammaproteobacteria bacterium]